MPALKVFLCHSSDDKATVRSLYHRLVADGFSPWLDEEELLPGQDWEDEIPNAVRESDIVIVCLSQGSITKKGYVQKEIKFALDIADRQPPGTIFIIPLKLEPCHVPGRLTRWHWVSLFDEKGYDRLKRALVRRATGNLTTQVSAANPTATIHQLDSRLGMASASVDQTEKGPEKSFALPMAGGAAVDAIRKPALSKAKGDYAGEGKRTLVDRVLSVYRSVSRVAAWIFGAAAVAIVLIAIFGHVPTSRLPFLVFSWALAVFLFSLFLGGSLLKGTLSGLMLSSLAGLVFFAVVRFTHRPVNTETVALPTATMTPSSANYSAPTMPSPSPSQTSGTSPYPAHSSGIPTPSPTPRKKKGTVGTKDSKLKTMWDKAKGILKP